MNDVNYFILHSVLVLLGLTGYLLAHYIYRKKKNDHPLVCPLKTNCDAVTRSTFSKFLGIPVEKLGMTYYMVIALVHTVLIAYPAFFTEFNAQLILIFSAFAVLFSIYLIAIQAFVLKQWCTWCVCSAFICLAILLETIVATPKAVFTALGI